MRCPQLGAYILDGCRCAAGLNGTITPSLAAPYYLEDCRPVACPANSHGEDVLKGCLCGPGFQGSVAPKAALPFYEGACEAVKCPPEALGASVPAGLLDKVKGHHMNSIVFICHHHHHHHHHESKLSAEDAIAKLVTKALCEPRMRGLVGSKRGLKTWILGHTRVLYSIEVFQNLRTPFFNSSCSAVPCPVGTFGDDLASGCTCLPGTNGTIVATQVASKAID